MAASVWWHPKVAGRRRGVAMDALHGWKDVIGASVRPLCDFPIAVSQSALLVVDMQNYICREDVGLGLTITKCPDVSDYYFSRLAKLVIPNIKMLVTFFRTHRLPLVYLRVGALFSDGRDLSRLKRGRDVAFPQYAIGSYPHDIIDELKPLEGEIVLDKNSSGAFTSTSIDQLLRNMEITSLVVTGVATNSCVNLTASEAADRGYACVLVNDACATFGQNVHDVTLATFARIYGLVWDTDEVVEYYSRALAKEGGKRTMLQG